MDVETLMTINAHGTGAKALGRQSAEEEALLKPSVDLQRQIMDVERQLWMLTPDQEEAMRTLLSLRCTLQQLDQSLNVPSSNDASADLGGQRSGTP